MSKFFVYTRTQYCLLLLLSSYTIGAAEVEIVPASLHWSKSDWNDQAKDIGRKLEGQILLYGQGHALPRENSQVIIDLLPNDVDQLIPDSEYRPTSILHGAVKLGNEFLFDAVLKRRPNPNIVDGYGKLPVVYVLEGIWTSIQNGQPRKSKGNPKKAIFDNMLEELLIQGVCISCTEKQLVQTSQEQVDTKTPYMIDRLKKKMKKVGPLYSIKEVSEAIDDTTWIPIIIPRDIRDLIVGFNFYQHTCLSYA